MLMRKLVLRAVALAVVLSPALVFTQGGKTKPTTATYITKEEVDIVNSQGQGIDRNIKTVDIGHENFSVGIIHRGKKVNGVAVPAQGQLPTQQPPAGALPQLQPPRHAGARWRLLQPAGLLGESLTIRRPKATTSSPAVERCSPTDISSTDATTPRRT